MDNWIKKVFSFGDINVVTKKNDYVLHLEATTHLTAPLCRMDTAFSLINDMSCAKEDGGFISYKPAENGLISYYLVDVPENENEAINKAVASLEAIKQMVEALTYGK